jgi:hypothetical protein
MRRADVPATPAPVPGMVLLISQHRTQTPGIPLLARRRLSRGAYALLEAFRVGQTGIQGHTAYEQLMEAAGYASRAAIARALADLKASWSSQLRSNGQRAKSGVSWCNTLAPLLPCLMTPGLNTSTGRGVNRGRSPNVCGNSRRTLNGWRPPPTGRQISAKRHKTPRRSKHTERSQMKNPDRTARSNTAPRASRRDSKENEADARPGSAQGRPPCRRLV